MRRAFFDSVTRVLKSHGFVETNAPGDLWLDVPDDFAYEPGTVALNAQGDGVEPYTPPPPSLEDRLDRVLPSTDFAQVLFEAFFEIANRLQALESKPEITRAQLRDWFKAKLG